MDREIMQTNKMDPEKFRPDEAKALDTKKIMDEIKDKSYSYKRKTECNSI